MIEAIVQSIQKGFETKLSKIEISDNLQLVLIPFKNSFLTEKQANQILVYQDLFISNKPFYQNLIQSKLGKNQTIYARQCTLQLLDKDTFNAFCNQYHYLFAGNCKVRYGLYHQEKLVMIAGFSKPKLMYRENKKFHSGMLIRSATQYGTTVTGGISKLLKKYIDTEKPDDLVTYIDTDFFDGAGFIAQGFKPYKTLEKQVSWLHIESKLRYSTDQLVKKYKAQILKDQEIDYTPKGYMPIFHHHTIKMVREI